MVKIAYGAYTRPIVRYACSIGPLVTILGVGAILDHLGHVT